MYWNEVILVLIHQFFWTPKPCTKEKMNYGLFAQIKAGKLHTDSKIAQIKGASFAHFY